MPSAAPSVDSVGVPSSERERTVELPPCWQGDAVAEPLPYRFADSVRPWNWRELDAKDAGLLWSTLSEFVAFFNARYGERSDRRIPPCWAEHGPLVEEVTTLYFSRWYVFESPRGSASGAQAWHALVLPGFCQRVAEWLGDDLLACQQGRHRAPAISLPDESTQRCTGRIAEADVQRRMGDQQVQGPKKSDTDDLSLSPREDEQ